MNLDFNKIYTIQSLNALTEKLTGKELHDDIIRHLSTKHPGKSSELIDVVTKQDFINALNKIKIECETNSIKPIIHLEMHGLDDKTGLSLISDNITWQEVYYNGSMFW